MSLDFGNMGLRLHRVTMDPSVAAFPLANVPPYISGELMWSYIARLALANGFSSALDFLNAVSRKWYTKKWHSFQDWNYDLDRAFIDYFISIEGLDWILDATLYTPMLPFSSRLSAIRRIYNHSTAVPRDDGLLRRPSSDITEIRICPECRREEEKEGLFHLKVVHQLPGMAVCPVHGCALQRFGGVQGEELVSSEWESVDVGRGAETIAAFWQDLIALRPTFTLEDTSAIFHSRFLDYMEAERSEEFHPKRLLLSDPVLSALCTGHPDLELLASNRLKAREKIDPSHVIEALVHLFTSAEGLCKAYRSNGKLEKDFLNVIDGKYSLLSHYNDALVRLKCLECGRAFASTPFSILTGIGCPECNRALDDEAIASRAISTITEGRWRYLSGYRDRYHIPTLEETGTGEQRRVSLPRLFFYGEGILERCEDEDEPIAEGFTVLSSEKKGNHYSLSLRHEECGGVFTVMKDDFLARPFCRLCDGNRDPVKAVARASGGVFTWTGDRENCIYSASDGKTEVTSRDLPSLLRKVERIAVHGTKRRDLKKEKGRIDEFIASAKGEVFFLEDMKSLADGQTVRNYCSRLAKLGVIKALPGVGCYSNAYEEHSLSEVLHSRFCIRHGVRIGLPLCDLLFKEAGCSVESPRLVYAIYKAKRNVKGHDVCLIDGKAAADIILSPVPVEEAKWQAAALVLTVKYRTLCSAWSDESVSTLVSWMKGSGITPDDIASFRSLLPSHIVNNALSLFGKGEGLWEGQ